MPTGRHRVPVVLQSTRFDCGVACLAAVFAAFDIPLTIAELRESLDPGRDGISALELRNEARRHGLDSRGVRIDSHDELARHQLPLLAHWEGAHYVVVTTVGRRSVTIMDPVVGRRRLDSAEYFDGASGTVLMFGRSAAYPPAPPGPRRRLATVVRSIVAPALRASPGLLGLLGLSSLLLLVVGLAVPVLTAQVIDAFLAPPGTPGGGPARLVAPVVGLVAVAAVVTLGRGLATAALQHRLGESLRTAFVDRFLGAPLPFVERRGSGELVARIMSSDTLRDALANRLVSALLDTVVGFVYLVIVVVADPTLGAVTAALAVVQLILLGAIAVRGRRLRREELLAEARSSSWLFELGSGLAWIKSAGAEQIVGAKAKLLYSFRLTAQHQAARNGAVAEAAASAVRIGGPLALLVAAASSATIGTAGRVVALAALATAALVPLGNIATSLRELYEIGSVVDHLEDLATAPAESAPTGSAAALPPVDRLSGAITASRLAFRFSRRDPWVVDDLSFHVPAGAKLAIVGASGSGKSTLAKLLVGLYEPTTGTVAVDGADLRSIDLASVRRLMGAVWQDPLLFSGTIHDNIRLRVPDASRESVRTATHLAAIDTDIMAMPMAYDTVLGATGEGLSGGQRQRLALARALVGRPAILVLDESTSHLDTPTEALVEQNLRAIGVTRIVIAHRLSTVHDADHILVMSRGRVVEQGTHHELMSQSGEYFRMVALQQSAMPAPT